MNKMTQAALATLVLGACSTAVFAGEEDRGYTPPKPEPECVDDSCRNYIPIEVTVAKTCSIKVDPVIKLAAGGTGTGSFTVGANTKYDLLVDTVNRVGPGATTKSLAKSGSNSIGITVETTGPSGAIKLNDPKKNITPGATGYDKYNVKVTSDAAGITKPAGTYLDKYNITVTL